MSRKLIKDLDREQPVNVLPGIGDALSYRLREAGFETVGKVFIKFEKLGRDEQKFKEWLKDTCDANSKQQQACYDYLMDVREKTSDAVNLCAPPDDLPPDDPPPGAAPCGVVINVTSTDATLKSQHEAYIVLGKFLELNMDEKRFQEWLKDTCGANSEQQNAYYTRVKEWGNRFIAEEYRRAIPGDAARGEVPPPGSTLADAMLEFKREMESVENLEAKMKKLNLKKCVKKFHD